MWNIGRRKVMDTRVLVNSPKWKMPFGRPRFKWGSNIKLDPEK
jgi:hypothetical protein